MKLVLLFFCVILLFILFIIILLLFSTIKLNVKNITIKNFENGTKKKNLEKEFCMYVELYLFGKIKFIKVKLTKSLLSRLKLQENMKNIKKDVEIIKKINVLEMVKALKIKIDKLNLEANIGTEDITLTVFIVTILSSLLGIIFRNCNYENIDYKIISLYQFGNTINFRLNCIISVKMVHIIYVIYILLKKGMIKNERTSNRRPYDYSYE